MTTPCPISRSIARRLFCVAPILVAACSEGGSEQRPQSDVRITANHHLYWFRSLPGFGTFPVNVDKVISGQGTLSLADNSTYQLLQGGSSTAPDRYGIATTGALSIYQTGSGRDPTIVFRGAYGLVGSNGNLFFTDRVSSGSSETIGLYYGVRAVTGQVELAGGWHLLSLHVVFATNQLLSPNNVARAAHGVVTVATGAPGELRAISGTGRESTGATLTLGGTIENVLQNGSGDGSCELAVQYTNGTATDTRVFAAAAGQGIVAAVDSDETDGEAGMLFLVRTFDTPATPVDLSRVAGDWLVGGHTVFINPTNSGSDAFVGTLSLATPDATNRQGAFRLDAEGHQGIDFTWTGAYQIAPDGGMIFTVAGQNETWTAAMNRTYDTLVIVDDVGEVTGQAAPELNLIVGTRVKTN